MLRPPSSFLRRALAWPALACAVGLVPADAAAQAQLPTGFSDRPIVSGLNTPVGMAFLPDGRLLFVEQITGRMRVVVNGAIAAIDPAGTVPDHRTDNDRRGVYGVAVDPRWPVAPYVYVHYSSVARKVVIARFTATGDVAFTANGAITISAATKYVVLDDPADAAHNGGTLRFGPDQMLYASIGDSITTPCAAQDTVTLRGVILRLEVRNLTAGSGGPPAKSLITPTAGNPFASHPSANARLVWATGLRNPFRFQVDAANGHLFIADVGEFGWEELDWADAGGLNFGWPIREGPDPFTSCPRTPGAVFTGPTTWYSDSLGQSIMSAGVYRRGAGGAATFPASYEGDVFFSDYYGGFVRRLVPDGGGFAPAPPAPGQPNATDWATGLNEVTDWAQAPDGSLWYLRQAIDFAPNTGVIRAISYSSPLGVEPEAGGKIGLAAPRPLPAHGRVTLGLTLPVRTVVEVAIHDVQGRRVRTLVARQALEAGTHELAWDGEDEAGRTVASGLYWIQLDAPSKRLRRRLVLLP